MDLEFELGASRNPYRTVFAKTQFSLVGFLAAQSLSVSSQPTGFQVKEPQIRTHRPRKPAVTYLRFDHGVLLSTSPILINTAIRLVGRTDGPILGRGPMVSENSPRPSLYERRVHTKFGCTVSYCVQMHKEREHDS